MQWAEKPHELKPKPITERIIMRFLFFPVCLDGTWKWLEFASILQRRGVYKEKYVNKPDEWWAACWYNKHWVIQKENQDDCSC